MSVEKVCRVEIRQKQRNIDERESFTCFFLLPFRVVFRFLTVLPVDCFHLNFVQDFLDEF